jgi:hypothetical protein
MPQALYTIHLEIGSGEVVAQVRDAAGALIARPQGLLAHDQADLEKARTLAARLSDNEHALKPQEVDEFGELLFRLLFPETIASRLYQLILEASQSPQGYLRIELEFWASAAGLAALPWENLCLPTTSPFPGLRLGVDRRVTLSRARPFDGRQARLLLNPGQELTIALAVAASPAIEEEHGEVAYKEVLQTLKDLATARMDTSTRVKILPEIIPATPRRLRSLLEDEQPHILHLIAHGEINDTFPDGALHLVDDITAGDDLVESKRLAELFADVPRPLLVVLQSCESGASLAERPYSGLANALAGIGIPGVAAVQYKISNGDAARFAAEFYDCLADSLPLDQAIQRGRQALIQDAQAGVGINLAFGVDKAISRAFFAPVFYLGSHSPDLLPRSSGADSPEALAHSLLNLPGILEIDPAFSAAIYEDCRPQARFAPLPPGLKTLPEQVTALSNVQLPQGQPEMLAIFAATLRARLPLGQAALSAALHDWLTANAQALTIKAHALDGLVAAHNPQSGPPVLQITLERDLTVASTDPAREKFFLSSRDGRAGQEFGPVNEAVMNAQLSTKFSERLSLFVNGLSDANERDLLALGEQLLIEFYLPKDMLSRAVERIPYQQIEIGKLFRVVVRSFDRWVFSANYTANWKTHWSVIRAALGLAAPGPGASPLDYTILHPQPTPDATLSAIETAASQYEVLGLAFEPDHQVLNKLLECGVPVAAWLCRKPEPSLDPTILQEALACLPKNIHQLQSIVRLKRAEGSLKNRLVLLWDDFDRGLGRDIHPVGDYQAVQGDTSFILD